MTVAEKRHVVDAVEVDADSERRGYGNVHGTVGYGMLAMSQGDLEDDWD